MLPPPPCVKELYTSSTPGGSGKHVSVPAFGQQKGADRAADQRACRPASSRENRHGGTGIHRDPRTREGPRDRTERRAEEKTPRTRRLGTLQRLPAPNADRIDQGVGHHDETGLSGDLEGKGLCVHLRHGCRHHFTDAGLPEPNLITNGETEGVGLLRGREAGQRQRRNQYCDCEMIHTAFWDRVI